MSSFIHLATGVPSLTKPVESLTVREDVPESMGKKSLRQTAVMVRADELAVDESDVIGFGGIGSYPRDEIAAKNRCRWYALLPMINSPSPLSDHGKVSRIYRRS